MIEKVLFQKTYSDYHTNGTNRSYWAKFFKIISEELHETKKIRLYSSYNENMPIYEFYSAIKSRYIRIMQYNPLDEIVASEKYSADRFYTAWIDERSESIDGARYPELVVCLLMTKSNVEKAERLIRSWLFGHDERTRELIESIYTEQERMDEVNKK